MSKVLIAVLSEDEFRRARGVIRGLRYFSYRDWLDSRYGRFMGLSIAGVDAALETIALDDFFAWCGDYNIRPSEAALDSFAQRRLAGSESEQAPGAILPGPNSAFRSA